MSHSAQKAGLLLLCHQRCAASNSQPPGKQKTRRKLAEWRFTLLPGLPCRVFVDQPLIAGTELSLPDAVVRHVQVLRLNAGDALTVFNGSPPIWSTGPDFGRRQARSTGTTGCRTGCLA